MCVLDEEQHGGPLRGEEGAICERAHRKFLALLSRKIGQFEVVAQIERKSSAYTGPTSAASSPYCESKPSSFSARAAASSLGASPATRVSRWMTG